MSAQVSAYQTVQKIYERLETESLSPLQKKTF